MRTNAVIAALIILFTMPSLSYPWMHPANSPAFFTTGIYLDYLRSDDNVLVLPFAWRGDSMLWQAETQMGFHLV